MNQDAVDTPEPAQEPTPATGASVTSSTPDAAAVSEGKIIAIFSYFGVFCLLPLLLKRDNAFAQFHGKQGLVLFFAGLLTLLMNVIPSIGVVMSSITVLVLGVLSLIGIVQVLMGNYWKIPVIGDWAEKINI